MLIIDDLSVRVAGRLLIEHASIRIPPGSRVGFVGRNGSGKSTLFNVITHDVSAEHGDIELPSRWKVGRLAQEAPNGPDSLIDVVLEADLERGGLFRPLVGEEVLLADAPQAERLAGPGEVPIGRVEVVVLFDVDDLRPRPEVRQTRSQDGGIDVRVFLLDFQHGRLDNGGTGSGLVEYERPTTDHTDEHG